MAAALRGQNSRSWYDGLNLELQNDFMSIIHYVLLMIFQDTGVDHSNGILVVAWPRESNVLGCLEIPYKKTSLWARMLADSGHCKPFAYVATQCLETDA